MSSQFPALYQLLGGHFHQDWKCDHETEDEVIRSFVAAASSEMLSKARSELQSILRTTLNEEQMQDVIFEKIRCSYYYPYAWPSGRAWLEHVSGML